ncbi:outer membrane beta-barrel protein [Pseudocolwellia sp. HL-MZ7]|uniref:outer membrane beta-barrel protein n=1 Tax=Pseudocolwellia sp. HL-MZ7 TaxID=3400627 RepID=UPI003CF2F1F5
MMVNFRLIKKNSNLNYNSHAIAAGTRLDHSHRINTEFKIGFDKSIEVPGTTNSSTQALTDFNKYENLSALGKFYYGQTNSIGQIVLGYRFNDRKYTNNGQSYRDVKQNQLSATFFYRIAPKTRILLQASTEKFGYYDQSTSNGLIFNQSSDNNTFLTGIEWKATAKSTGIFKIGYQDKIYDDSRFNDISGLSYLLDMIWKPNTYTSIKLGASRQTTESAILNEGGFLTASYSLDVSHKITPRTIITAQYNISNDEIVSISSRTDKSNSIRLSLNHSLRNWLNISLSYKYQEKKSNVDIYNFKSNIIGLTLETSF